MTVVVRGRVRSRALDLADPLSLPEGTEVVVSVEPVRAAGEPPAMSEEEFLALPFFGMWAEREEMRDSVAWVRRTREAWPQRTQCPD